MSRPAIPTPGHAINTGHDGTGFMWTCLCGAKSSDKNQWYQSAEYARTGGRRHALNSVKPPKPKRLHPEQNEWDLHVWRETPETETTEALFTISYGKSLLVKALPAVMAAMRIDEWLQERRTKDS